MMISLYQYFFVDTGPFVARGPLFDIDKFRNTLFAMNFSREFLDKCERGYHWNFSSLLPALHDGSFYEDSRGLSPRWSKEDGRSMLLGFATALCRALDQHPEHAPREVRYFTDSLLEDGFQYVGGRLVETSQDIISEAEEISAVESLIRSSVHDNHTLLLHHFANGTNLFASGPPHACVGEWRAFLEEVLRGAWRLTRAHRPDLATYAEKPPIKDLFEFLRKAGFLSADEQLAFSSTWGFLSAGSHPGISDRDEAHLSMILALTFGHTALLKLQTWSAGSFTRF